MEAEELMSKEIFLQLKIKYLLVCQIIKNNNKIFSINKSRTIGNQSKQQQCVVLTGTNHTKLHRINAILHHPEFIKVTPNNSVLHSVSIVLNHCDWRLVVTSFFNNLFVSTCLRRCENNEWDSNNETAPTRSTLVLSKLLTFYPNLLGVRL